MFIYNVLFQKKNVLKPQKWYKNVSKKIYDDYGLPRGYHFENNYINSDKSSGGFKDKTKSKVLLQFNEKKNYIIFN